MKTRKERLPEIIDIINNNVIPSQADLSRELAARGYIITQATLSRDLKLLKASKVAEDDGTFRYVLGEPHQPVRGRGRRTTSASTSQMALSLTRNGCLLVIKTRNGYASGLAYDIDMLESPLLLGSMPGSDTVFVATAPDAPADQLFALLSRILPTAVMTQAKRYFLPADSPRRW